ncbi:hypothetical protein ACIBCM_31100 [Streptomyces sp. NPDC051018]|uniref:hypothetical protein n=1 Tax=Streptomyces sp. NPDC051018 TaxID=3365639 RepID=UPI0037B6F266
MSTVVAPVENLTALRVRVLAVGPHPRLAGWDLASVDVLSAAPVAGRADLLSERAGGRVELAVRRELLSGAGGGSVLALRARLWMGEIMAEPHPLPQDFTIEPERP